MSSKLPLAVSQLWKTFPKLWHIRGCSFSISNAGRRNTMFWPESDERGSGLSLHLAYCGPAFRFCRGPPSCLAGSRANLIKLPPCIGGHSPARGSVFVRHLALDGARSNLLFLASQEICIDDTRSTGSGLRPAFGAFVSIAPLFQLLPLLSL